MALFLSSVQCLAIGIFVFGFLGFLQGWARATVLMGFTLAAVLFLYIGGANGIATVLFVRIPQTINVLTGGAVGPKSPSPPGATQVVISALLTLAVAMLLGFFLGRRGFPALKAGDPPLRFTAHTGARFIGIIPGMVTGYAVIAYVGHLFQSNPSVSVGVTTPSTSALGSYIVILVIIAIVALVLGLLTRRFGQ